jgi:GNAT superfamily N-acetyltransferase
MKTAKPYRIIDLDEKTKGPYFACLEPETPEMLEAKVHKTRWYDKMKSQGLGVKIAVDEKGEAVGMIQYTPAQYSPVVGENFYFINCIWIPIRKDREQNYRRMGIGAALLAEAETDAKKRGAKALLAWGLTLPVFMRASWFKKQGYLPVDKQGMQVLLWKPFVVGLTPPAWTGQKKIPARNTNPGKITVTAFLSGGCPVANYNYEKAKRAAAEFEGKTCFNTVDISQTKNIVEWGLADAIFVEDKCISGGPPLTYKQIKAKIAAAVKRLGK